MTYFCNTRGCCDFQSKGCCGLCLSCWLKLSEADREKRRKAAEIAERELGKAVGNG